MIDYVECGAVGAMSGRGNRNTWRKPEPVPLCLPQIPYDQIRARTRAVTVGSRLRKALDLYVNQDTGYPE
jgi:hypothetical protein